jgi:hypothetical protein
MTEWDNNFSIYRDFSCEPDEIIVNCLYTTGYHLIQMTNQFVKDNLEKLKNKRVRLLFQYEANSKEYIVITACIMSVAKNIMIKGNSDQRYYAAIKFK